MKAVFLAHLVSWFAIDHMKGTTESLVDTSGIRQGVQIRFLHLRQERYR